MSDEESSSPQTWAVTTLREDVETTKRFVAFHFAAGDETIHLYLDDPEDKAAAPARFSHASRNSPRRSMPSLSQNRTPKKRRPRPPRRAKSHSGARGSKFICAATTPNARRRGFEIKAAKPDAPGLVRRSYFLDVGANAGIYSGLCAQVGAPESEAISFEPNPVMMRRLERTIALNGYGDVTQRQVALGDEQGEADFFVRRNSGHSSLIGDGPPSTETLAFRQEVVAEHRFHDLARFDFGDMKSDIEGAGPKRLDPLFASDGAKPIFIQYEHAHAWGVRPEALFASGGDETRAAFAKKSWRSCARDQR